ncbi:MAG: TetR/AcrR family transcriptional regulator [Flavonifractor plautii]
MSKKQALTEFHRGSILAAAERLFAEKGTEKTTMDDIAREAEYSKATLYVYFQSKEEIINAILLSGMVLLKKKIHEAIESHSDWYQAYDAVCRSIVRFYDENPTAYDAATGTMPLVQEADETQKGVADILRVSGEIDEELAAFLVRGAAEGAVRSQLPLWRRFCCSGPPCPAWCIPPISGRDIFRRPSVCPGRSFSSTAPACYWPLSPRSTHNQKSAPAAAGALFWIYSAVSTGCSPSAEAWMLWMGWR